MLYYLYLSTVLLAVFDLGDSPTERGWHVHNYIKADSDLGLINQCVCRDLPIQGSL